MDFYLKNIYIYNKGFSMEKPEYFDKEGEEIIQQDSITDFVELVACIVDYYGHENKKTDSEEAWKKGSKYEHKNIPEEIDNLVENAFKTQLKKFH